MAIWQDIRYGARVLQNNPGFTVVVILVLALGIGANSAVFTLVNSVLFRPLPFAHGERIVVLFCNNPSKGEYRQGVSYPDFDDWRKEAKSFDGLAAWSADSVNLSDRIGVPERYASTRMSANAFSLIGQKPVLGRDFTAEDTKPGATPVVLLGYGLWQGRYRGDSQIVGRTIRLNEVPALVIGVMPEGLRFPLSSDLWEPLIQTPELLKRDAREIVVFGSMSPGVTLQNARSEMDLIARRLQKEYPKSNAGVVVEVNTFNTTFSASIRVLFLALLGAVGFVLLIACANVANLMLSRAMSRLREVSIRASVGATRWRLIQQLLIESLLLALAGGVLGLALAVAGVRAFDLAVAAVDKPYWIKFTMDWTVFGYIAAISLGTGILFGLFPAIQASRADLHTGLKEGSRTAGTGLRSRYLSAGLVITELALALVLLAGAGLLIRSFLNLYAIQSGVNASNLLTMHVDLPAAKYPTAESRRQLRDRMLAGLASVPGVESVALASHAPLQGSFAWNFQLEGRVPASVASTPSVSGLFITPGYFQTVGAALLRGHGFSETDGADGRNSVVVNQRLARKYWPGQDPLGKRVRLMRDPGDDWFTVVGVSPDLRQNDPGAHPEPDPLVYLPYRQAPSNWATILARTRTAPTSIIADLRKRVQSLDEDLPLFRVMTMDQVFDQQRWPYHVFGGMFLIFACVALLVSMIGIYGVMAYAVTQRSREFGLRIALGASGQNIFSLVIFHGAVQVGIGLLLGTLGALTVTKVLKSMLIRITPTDPITFVAAALMLTVAAALACWFPARRALKVDPAVVLRYE